MRMGAEALQRDSKGIFRFNPGIEQKTVPDYNPYTIRRCQDCDIAKGKTNLAKVFIPDNELCAGCQLLHKCVADESKSQKAIERIHYLHEMEPLLRKKHEKLTFDNKHIKVGFSVYGNKHLFSDTFGRSKILSKDDLKNLDEVLEKSVYIGQSSLTHPRNDNIVHFYYYEAELHGKKIRLNVAKEVNTQPNGKKQILYYLYSINDIK